MSFVLELFDLEPAGKKIGELHGQQFEAEASYGKVLIVPLYHPAVALYVRERKETLMRDFQRLKPFV